MRRRIFLLLTGMAGLAAAWDLGAGWFDPVPLTEMRGLRYKTFAGGLYPGGNVMPPDHASIGAAHAAAIQPRNASGAPDPAGRYVLLSIGMSNTTPTCSRYSSPAASTAATPPPRSTPSPTPTSRASR